MNALEFLRQFETNGRLSVSENFQRVDFRQPDPDPFEQLRWGITGRRSDMRF